MIGVRTSVVAALDIGSSKICCFIAVAEGGDIRMIGAAHRASIGLRNGCVIDMDAAQHAILETVERAEANAGERVERISVNLSAREFHSHLRNIEVEIDGHQIDNADIEQIHRSSLELSIPDDRILLHCIPIGYAIDGHRGIRDPRGMYGEVLGARFHQIAVAAAPLRNLHVCVERCHLEIDNFAVSPYAAGLACLVEDEREMGVTLVDIGGGTTTVASFQDGEIVFADAIPVGGGHITKDIAHGLSTPLADAERMKILCGEADATLHADDDVIDVPLLGERAHQQANHVRRSVLAGILRPRVEEIFEFVRRGLDDAGLDPTVTQRVVLTGGGAQLQGIQGCAERMLATQVRIGRPMGVSGLAEATSGPAFAVCGGLLHYAVGRHGEPRDDEHGRKGRLRRLGHWLRENL